MLNKNLLNEWRLWAKNNNIVIQKRERGGKEREREKKKTENTEGDNVIKGRDIMEYNRNISSQHLILILAVWGVTPSEKASAGFQGLRIKSSWQSHIKSLVS